MNEIVNLIEAVEALVPEYMANPEDYKISQGSACICVIDEDQNVYSKMFGDDKIRTRHSYKIAWTKASQVWITGYRTGEYEKLVFSGEVDDSKYGISRPDLLGWEGGQPLTLKSGRKVSVGFSGFRGDSDLEIVVRANGV